MAPAISTEDAAAFERCIRGGGVAIFPADTVYGIACDPDSAAAIARMYALKGRATSKPSALMFFALEAALRALPELGELTEQAVRALLPGPVTVVLPNPSGVFALATSAERLGLRVPELEGALAPLAGVRSPVLQTSANLSGEPDPRSMSDIPRSLLEGVDVVVDGGELSGSPSSVVDLTRYEHDGTWELLREAALDRRRLAKVLDAARGRRAPGPEKGALS